MQLKDLNRFDYNKITLEELKKILISYYYPKMTKDQLKKEMKRDLIITKCKNCYGSCSTIIFSVNGSPPKGEAILFLPSYQTEYKGKIVFFGNWRVSKDYLVIIK